jgi:hypothetical protein
VVCLLTALVVALSGCDTAPAREPASALVLGLHSTTATYDQPGDFRLSVTFHNRGESPWVVLPGTLRRSYVPLSGAEARQVPLPAPRPLPWKDAFALLPGERRVLVLSGMRDADGIWDLGAGRYELAVELHVTPDLARSAGDRVSELGAPVWLGRVRSPAIPVRYTGKRP